MGSDFIEDPVGGDVPRRFISIKLGPMTFRLNSQGVIFPHIFVWGSCFWFCIPLPPPGPAASADFVITFFHTQLCHTLFHTQLCHTPSFTHNFVTHQPSHTTLSHTLFHTLLCHTHHLLHTAWSDHTLSPITLSPTHTPSLCVAGVEGVALGGALGAHWSRGDAAALCVAGVALGDIYRRFAWRTWHLWHWAGSGGALGAPW